MDRRAFGFVAALTAALLDGCGDDSTNAGTYDAGPGPGAGDSSSGSSGGSSSGSSSGGSDSGGSSAGGGSEAGRSDDAGTGDDGGGSEAGAPPNDGGISGGGDAPDETSGTNKRFACPPGPFPAPSAGTMQSVCDGFSFKYDLQDGPTWVSSEQAFFFSNYVRGAAGPGDIIKYTPGGQCEVWLSDAGCNGLTAAYDGNLVAACQTARAVVAFDLATKQPTTLASMYGGQLLDSPNDIVAHSSGSIFFTNPTYELGGRPAGVGPAEFTIDASGTLKLIATTHGVQPNGIALSPDETRLYVEEDSAGVKVYDLDPTGVPQGGGRPFAGTTDGISVDCAGNLYLSGGAIVSPAGTPIGSFPGGGSMAAFGGADGTTLLIVGAGGGTSMYTVQMNLPGPPH